MISNSGKSISTCLVLATIFCLAQVISWAQKKTGGQDRKPQEVDDVVRTNTELVQTDVMVFDKEGRFVEGLQREQFELEVDGKQQPITFFESVVAGSISEAAAARTARVNTQPHPSVEPATSTRGRNILFFINDLNLTPGNGSRTRDSLNYFIDHMMKENDQVAITSASGQIGFLQQMTNNTAVLKAAIARLNYIATRSRDGQRPTISEYSAYVIEQLNDRALFDYFVLQTMKSQNVDEPIAIQIVRQRVRMTLRQSDASVKIVLSSLVELMRSLAKLQGRKLVFFISDGFVLNMGGSDGTEVLRRATDAAARAGVVIYSIDARGLDVDSWLDASDSGGFDPTGVLMSRSGRERSFTQEPLYALAADTGGRAIFNTNSITNGMARGLDETSRYYLLAWRPESVEQRATNFPKVKVSIAGRPDLKVQVRRGYFRAPAPKEEEKKTAPPAVAGQSTEPTTELVSVTETAEADQPLPTSLFVGYKKPAGAGMQLTAAIQVSQQTPDGSDQKKVQNIAVDVLGAVFDSKGKSIGSFKQKASVPPASQTSPAFANVNYQIDVAPGLYQVRILTRDTRNGHLSGAMEWIDVPNIKPGTFSTSTLYAGEIVAGESKTTEAQVGVNARGRFARTSKLRFTTYLYNAGQGATPPDIGIQIQIVRAGQPVITLPERKLATEKLTDFATIPYTGEFPLSALPPGPYSLQLTFVNHAKPEQLSRRIDFTVY